MAYSASSNSILVSFVIVLDPDIRLMEEANIFLNIFNTLIYNNVGFNDIKFFNDITCISTLLPNISLFSRKFLTILNNFFIFYYFKGNVFVFSSENFFTGRTLQDIV
jgi:hypothetical protein